MATPEKELNLRVRHPEFQSHLDFNESESLRVKDRFQHRLDCQYGDSRFQAMDVFPSPIADSPVLVFIHGGYWKGLDKSSYSFVAEPFVENQFSVCVLNYRLIPQVRMADVFEDVQKSLEWIVENSNNINADPHRITLSGHSAGGHLALMSYLKCKSIQSHVRAICSLSGIFDLARIKDSYLNDELNLDETEVKKFGLRLGENVDLDCHCYIGVGSDETQFFIEQSQTLHSQLECVESKRYHEFQGLNHYQVVHELGNPNSDIAQFILDVGDKK